MKNIFFLLAIISFIGCKNKTKEKDENTVSDPVWLSMNRNADSLLLDPKINAVSIGIYKDGKTYTGHYGELDKEKGNPPTDSTIYEIASVSKTFAGILVARAVMDDTLDLEEDIRKYLRDDYPNLEYKGKPIKIKHLITHTSRLPKFLPDSINVLFEHIDENLPFNIYKVEKNTIDKSFYRTCTLLL
ncbi:class A beta-lactamase-related serine hydrolase [Sinomicrobium pectinilyticum]|uniref:Class A beta-lactamase-related serine hydrolase n=1 Tax=Sinomicrobium pectinilyticum TaxID=1084421 RepID=A0A3N0EU64_SINP1|nr:serine hydrolase domain-containing protein [Sinomicrobium pectinilyticum]RNL91312.1 class A beta-lactamase-related serine hydrolase [Sinomicrobium pectinilyticum]